MNPNHTIIKVTNKKTGKISEIIIDKKNEIMLMKYTWYVSDNGYAITTFVDENKKNCKVRMHKMLLKGKIIDHIDRNKLNNTMENLRISSRKENALNQSHKITAKSRYRGVTFRKKENKFYTQVRGKHVGWFHDEISAAYAYNQYILEHFPNDENLMRNLNDVAKPNNFMLNHVKTKKDPTLPRGISFRKRQNAYILFFGFKTEKMTKEVRIKDREEALQKYNEILDELKHKWETKMNALPIIRNADNIAVIRTSKWKSNISEEKKAQEILVDDEDWHRLIKMPTWCITKKGYAQSSNKFMHRIIMNCSEHDADNNVDHIDNNKINNQKSNLRKLPKNDSLHAHNRRKQRNTCSSKYIGVSYIKTRRKWQMAITHLGKKTNKLFDTEEEAARFYDQKATELYGTNAKLNFPTNKSLLQKRTFDQIEDAVETSNKRSKHTTA